MQTIQRRPAAAKQRQRAGAPAAGAPAGRRVAVLVLLVLTAGCVRYQAAPLDPKSGVADFAARRLSDPLPGPPQEWDRGQLLVVALAQNPQIAVARAQVAAALAHEVTAGEAPNPDLIVQSEYARHEAHPWLYGVSLNWLLRSSERRRLEQQEAGLGTHNARLQLMDQAWSVRRSLASALSDWESARRRLRLLDTLATSQDRLLAIEQQRVAAGEDAPVELITGQQARIQIEQQLAELRELTGVAQAAAAKALGLPPQALDGINFVWRDWGAPPELEDASLREVREQALLSRTDFAIAIGDYAQAESKLKLSIARQYPEFVLGPGYYWDHGVAKFPLDVGFTLPFNRNRGEIAEARAGREVAGRHMLAVQAEIYGDIAAAERAELVARWSAAAAEQQLSVAQQQKQQAELALQLGASDRQQQIGADILITRAALEVLQMRTAVQNSRNTLEDALHVPLSGPELLLADPLVSNASGAGS